MWHPLKLLAMAPKSTHLIIFTQQHILYAYTFLSNWTFWNQGYVLKKYIISRKFETRTLTKKLKNCRPMQQCHQFESIQTLELSFRAIISLFSSFKVAFSCSDARRVKDKNLFLFVSEIISETYHIIHAQPRQIKLRE